MGLTFWLAFALLYPTVKLLETGGRVINFVKSKTKKV